MAPDGHGEPTGLRVWVAPRAAVRVLDNWHVMGVAGSGSFDYEVEDLFVPDGYWFEFVGATRRRGGGRYDVPIGVQLGAAHCGFALGAGERAIDEIAVLATTKQRFLSASKLAERPTFQRDLGHAHASLSAARHHVATVLARLAICYERSTPVPDRLQVELRTAATYATDVAVAVAQTALRYAAGTGVRLDNPIQRVLRELLVAQSHMYVSEANYEKLGIELLVASGAAENVGARGVGFR